PLLPHHGRHRLDAVERAGEVHVDDFRPLLDRHAVEIVERDRLVVGCVVDEDVDPAEALHDLIDQLPDLRRLGHVAGEGNRLDAVPGQLVRDRVGVLGALRIDDRDVGALGGERVTDALPQSAIAAGDDRDAVFQIHGFPRLTVPYSDTLHAGYDTTMMFAP